jgi:hypothetical protein
MQEASPLPVSREGRHRLLESGRITVHRQHATRRAGLEDAERMAATPDGPIQVEAGSSGVEELDDLIAEDWLVE